MERCEPNLEKSFIKRIQYWLEKKYKNKCFLVYMYVSASYSSSQATYKHISKRCTHDNQASSATAASLATITTDIMLVVFMYMDALQLAGNVRTQELWQLAVGRPLHHVNATHSVKANQVIEYQTAIIF